MALEHPINTTVARQGATEFCHGSLNLELQTMDIDLVCFQHQNMAVHMDLLMDFVARWKFSCTICILPEWVKYTGSKLGLCTIIL